MNFGLIPCVFLTGIALLIFDCCISQKTVTIRKSASLGGQQKLDCDLRYPRGQPVPYIIQWKKDGLQQPIFIKYDGYPAQVPTNNTRGRIELADIVSLEISHIEAEDEGWYECNIIFIDGAEETTVNGSWIYLTVHSPPRIVASSRKLLQHRRGESITLFCRGKGSPKPTLTWYKDGRPLQDSLRVRVENKDVKISNVQRDDGGIYMCTFSNSVGAISQLIKLVVEGGPYIMVSPHNVTAIEGQRNKFPCGAEAYPNNITYSWFKDGIDVETLPGFQVGRISISPDGNLLISSVIKDDMAWYMCRPSNGIGEDEASAYLNVTYFPKVLPMPSQLTWAKGFREKIDCPVDANPSMTETIWTKDAMILDSTGRMAILTNGTLVIRNVTLLDSGSYSCTPVSLLGRGETSPHVQVIVRDVTDPPYFILRPRSLYQKNPGQSVVLPCSATRNPGAFTQLEEGELRNNHCSFVFVQGVVEINDRVHNKQGNLSFTNLGKEDHGIYECVASNSIATIIAVTELRVMNTTPHAPYNVTVLTDLFSARVSWEPAYDGGSPQTYILWFRVGAEDSTNWETMRVPQGSTTFTLYTLMPNTMYEFMVLSRNEYGDGMYSKRVLAKTRGFHMDLVTALPTDGYGSTYIPDIKESIGPSPSPPQNVTASVTEGGILVSWQHPHNTSVPIFSYTVLFRRDGRWTCYNTFSLADAPPILMKEMAPGTAYQIRVISNGVLAMSEPSNIVTVTTKSAVRRSSSNSASSESLTLPDALIGGIIGGLLFLLVAILLAVIAVIHSRKKEQKTKANNRFTDVNYSKPEDTDSRHQTPPKWDRWQHGRGGDTLTSHNGSQHGVFVLPQTADLDTKRDMHQSVLRDSRLYDRDHPMYNPDSGYRVAPSSDRSVHDSMPMATVSLSRAPSRGSRSLSPGQPRDEPDWPRTYPSSVVPHGERSGHYPDSYHSPQYPLSYPDPYPKGSHQMRGPSLSPVAGGYDGPFQSFEDDDDVFPIQHRNNVPSTTSRPGFPRHSSMKPASQQQTYLTEPSPSYGLNDISSVLPSSFSDPSRDPSLMRYPYDPYDPSFKSMSSQPERRAPRYPRDSSPWDDSSRHSSGPRSRPRSREGSYNIPKETREYSPNRDKQIARVLPSKPDENNSSNGSSNGRPMGYTREQLQGVVDRVRQTSRPVSTENINDDNGFLDVSSVSRPRSSSQYDPQPHLDRRGPPYYTADIAPFKPPRDSRGSANSSGRGGPRDFHRSRGDETGPDSVSHSSGIGSRNTSHSNGSFPNRLGKNSISYSSLLTPQDQDLSQDSSPFLEGSSSHRRDTSGDENYEFDSINALESDILDALRNYSQLSGSGPQSDHLGPESFNHLYPKPRRQSRYADSEQRFNRLREEFKKYRAQQDTVEPRGDNSRPLYPMDSEML
ncbi:LOW QUALITY PROTEIN: protein turtle homolog A-like [Haliotis rubra]|uniref:LOW QUALITY PROTEIN: protein turtle homolog A-like n=1 Tax=Haliotis rubra TaxID=36100 RepID=UPI001EE5B28E|nr:LOW QUALITY PROTEIN: protein turtle homolog A-like [Haliotis rubra]